MTKRYPFAGLELEICDDWFDVTDDLPAGSPPTLAPAEGVGALQFSVVWYESGKEPNVTPGALTDLLREFGEQRRLGVLSNEVSVEGPGTSLVSGDFQSAGEFIRVWYVSNGRDIALVTYCCTTPGAQIADELKDTDAMVRSLSFAPSQ